MRRVILTMLMIISIAVGAKDRREDSVAMAYRIEGINDNLGLHLDLSIPIIKSIVAVRASGGFIFDGPDYPDPTAAYLLGIRGNRRVSDIIKLYGEGGALLLKDSDVTFGGYGIFGFEFFTSKDYKSPISYFIELGARGCPDTIYNGFTSNVGFKFYF